MATKILPGSQVEASDDMARKPVLPRGLYWRNHVIWMDFTTPAGRRIRKSLRTDDRDLAEKYFEREKARLLDVEDGHRKPQPTLKAFRKSYKRYVKVRNTGWQSDLRRLDRFLNFVGKLRVDNFRPDDVQSFQQYRLESVKPATLKRDLSVARAAFAWGVRHGWLSLKENPFNKVADVPVPRRRRIDYLIEEEWEALLEAAQRPPIGGNGAVGKRFTPIYPMVAVALFTGLRLSELLHLEWKDIDLSQRREIWVRHRPGHKRTKDQEDRCVPIPKRLRAILEEYRKADARQIDGADWVFQTRNGTVYEPNNALRTLRGLAKAAELQKKRLSWTLLRHTFASHLVMQGVNIFKVSKLLGHSSVKTTEQYYADLAPNRLHDEVDGAFG